uniref:Ig-like domain-containing protein n=1 Tax=Amphilophus citrinellus TaxID=61819 RepID=A0A3Q0SMD0_AMPCI
FSWEPPNPDLSVGFPAGEAYEGYSESISCPYESQYQNNLKYICKGNQPSTCLDMVTSQSRFTLQDDALSSSFSVMITELEAADAGTYWCGSDSLWRVGNYTKIELSVGEVNNCVHDKFNIVSGQLFKSVQPFLAFSKQFTVKGVY